MDVCVYICVRASNHRVLFGLRIVNYGFTTGICCKVDCTKLYMRVRILSKGAARRKDVSVYYTEANSN